MLYTIIRQRIVLALLFIPGHMLAMLPPLKQPTVNKNLQTSGNATYLPQNVTLAYANKKKVNYKNFSLVLEKPLTSQEIIMLANLQYKLAFFALERINIDTPAFDFFWRKSSLDTQIKKAPVTTELAQIFGSMLHQFNYIGALVHASKNFKNISPQKLGKAIIGIHPILWDLIPHYHDITTDLNFITTMDTTKTESISQEFKRNFSRLFFLLTCIPEGNKVSKYYREHNFVPFLGSAHYYALPKISQKQQLTPSSEESIIEQLYYPDDMDQEIIKMNQGKGIHPNLNSPDADWSTITRTYNLLSEVQFDRTKSHEKIWGIPPTNLPQNNKQSLDKLPPLCPKKTDRNSYDKIVSLFFPKKNNEPRALDKHNR